MNYFLIILLIVIASWREVQILIDRDSWKGTSRIPLWYIDQNSKEKILWLFPKKNLDSFHVSNGLFTLILIHILYTNNILPELLYVFCDTLTHILHIIAYWLIWMQIRNIVMKVNYRR